MNSPSHVAIDGGHWDRDPSDPEAVYFPCWRIEAFDPAVHMTEHGWCRSDVNLIDTPEDAAYYRQKLEEWNKPQYPYRPAIVF